MSQKGKFSDKHGEDAAPDPAIETEVKQLVKNGELPCAVAFKIAGKLNVSPAEVGKTVDLLEYRLTKCQMGLFGYTQGGKKVTAQAPENPHVGDAIRAALVNGRLPCTEAWRISSDYNLTKLAMGNVCEGMGVKVKPCQLGAF